MGVVVKLDEYKELKEKIEQKEKPVCPYCHNTGSVRVGDYDLEDCFFCR